MNFDTAIKAHAAWKAKLAHYLYKPDGSIDRKVLTMDNQCELGRWIHGHASEFMSDTVFQDLKQEHANFHRAAGQLVERADRGEKVSEEAALGSDSPYAKCSSRVVQLILEMKRRQPVGV